MAALEYRVSAPPPDLSTQFLRRNPVTDQSPPQSLVARVRFAAYMTGLQSDALG